MVLLDPDAFLTQLTRVLEKNRSGGTIYVTMKRCARARSNRRPRPAARSFHAARAAADAGVEGKKGLPVDPADCRCLVRAVGAKQKFSTLIAAKDHRRFAQSYGNIMKVSLDALKKKERKRGDKKKGTT